MICKYSEVIFFGVFHVGINVGSRSEPWLCLLKFLEYDKESCRELFCTSFLHGEDKLLAVNSLGGSQMCWFFGGD